MSTKNNSEMHLKNQRDTPRASWREWIGLVALISPVFMISSDMTVLFLATPSIAADLAPSGTQMLWILHVSEFLAVGLVLTMGCLGDKVGRRRLLVIGVTVYGLASVGAAFSTTAWMLIAIRALLGVAAATVMPSTMSLLRNMFPDPKQFSVAIAINLSAFSAGMALGPPIGGLLLDHFWWRAVFLLNVPAAVLLLMVAPVLPTYRHAKAKRLDIISVALSMLALISFVFGLQEIAENGFKFLYICAVIIGIILAFLFVRRQSSLADPLLDLRMFRTSAFSISLIAVLLVLLVSGGSDMLFAQHLQAVLGLSPTQAGFLLIIPAVLAFIGTLVAPVLARWIHLKYVMASGLIFASSGAALVMMNATESNVVILIAGVSMISFGIGPTLTLGSELIVSSVPNERAGSASAMQDVSSGLGNALGMAALGSFSMAIYRGTLIGTTPGAVSDDARNVAESSIGGALEIVDQLPDSLRAEMLGAVRTSFSLGIQMIYGLVAIVLIFVAVLLVWRLQHISPNA